MLSLLCIRPLTGAFTTAEIRNPKLSYLDFFHGHKKSCVCRVTVGMALLMVMSSASIIVPAHALAANVYEMGYVLQYCPFGFCDNYEYFNGASGTVSSSYPIPASTDSYNWALSLDNVDNNVHTWFQAGITVGLDPNNNFHSVPTFYVETKTVTAHTFQTFPASASQHSITICVPGVVCPGVPPSGNVQAWLDGSLIYNAPDPFPSGQQFIPGAFLEVHQAGTNYGIPVAGSWSNLLWSGGENPWCGRPWGQLFCNDLASTNSNTYAIPNPPTPYYVLFLSQTSFDAGIGPTPTLSLSTDPPSSFTLSCTYYAGCDPATPWYFYLHIHSLNGFSGTVTIGYTVNHYGGPNITGPTSASVSSGGSTTVTLYVQGGGATSGTYYWTLSGTGGGYTGSTTFTIYYSYCRSCLSPSPP